MLYGFIILYNRSTNEDNNSKLISDEIRRPKYVKIGTTYCSHNDEKIEQHGLKYYKDIWSCQLNCSVYRSPVICRVKIIGNNFMETEHVNYAAELQLVDLINGIYIMDGNTLIYSQGRLTSAVDIDGRKITRFFLKRIDTLDSRLAKIVDSNNAIQEFDEEPFNQDYDDGYIYG